MGKDRAIPSDTIYTIVYAECTEIQIETESNYRLGLGDGCRAR
jgi:hypothetical protein